MFTCLYCVNRKSHRVQKRSCILLGKQVNLRIILYSIAVSHNNCKVIMGAFGSKKGLKSCLIGDETLAKESLPTVSDSRWTKCGQISELYIYPVKALQPIVVATATIEKHGLKNGKYLDRQFVIVDGKNNYCNATRHNGSKAFEI